jgi:membrane-associated phospholipid phosphatase
MLIAVVIGLGSAVGTIVALQARRWPAADPAAAATDAVGAEIRRGRVATFLRTRLDPATATGLALTVSLTIAVVAGTAVGVLFYILRTQPRLAAMDLSVARWAAEHATMISTAFLKTVTQLGSTIVVVVVGVIIGLGTSIATRRVAPAVFMLMVLVGNSAIVNLIKVLVDRARPTISMLTGFTGQSFPSGHSAAAAACWGAVALLVARHWSRSGRSAAYGTAAAIAVAVACSRVFLGVHWLSDVVAGLAVGWGWLSLCSIAFGGRLLEFGAPVEVAQGEISSAVDPRATRGRVPQ